MKKEMLTNILSVSSEQLVQSLTQALGTTVVFGPGTLSSLPSLPLPGKKALIVGYNRPYAKPRITYVAEQLEKVGVASAVYDKIEPNPTMEIIDAGGRFIREQGCDFVIAIGGGSVIDCGKNIAIMATNDGSIWDYVQMGSGGRKPVANAPLPIIAIPSTAGTGSEVNCGSSFSKESTNEKIALKDERLVPVITIIDPELNYEMPARFTAFQGWDALTHSMEYLINNKQDDTCDTFARQAIRLAGRALPKAVAGDPAARNEMALASALSGYVIGHCGTSSQHALECAVSGIYPKVAHGAGMLLLSNAYFAFLIEHNVCNDVFVDMAQLLGMEDAADPHDFLKIIRQIQKDCHVDDLKMRDFDIDPARFPEMVDISRFTMGYSHELDRRPLSDEDCVAILRNAYT